MSFRPVQSSMEIYDKDGRGGCDSPANFYLFKTTTETLKRGVKYVQS